MDQPNSATSTPPPSTSQPPTEPPSQPPPQPQPQPHPPPSSATTTAPPTPTPIPPSPNPNPNPIPSAPLPSPPLPTPPQPRPPPTLARPWPQSHFAHFPAPNSPASSGPPPPSPSPAASTPPPPRGGMAIGVPAHHPGTPPPQSAPFSSSYGHHFGGLGRGGVPVPEPVPNSNAPQARPSMQGMPGMGMMSSSSPMRAVGISAHHQQRPGQSPLRPPSAANNQPPSPQNFQGHSLLRASSGGSTSSPSTSQGFSPHTQPWLSSGSQGKPPIPSPAYRQQMSSSSLQQRPHLPQQQHHPLPTVSPSASHQQHHPMPPTSQQQQHPVPSVAQQQHHPGSPASQQQHHPGSPASQQQHHPGPPASQQQHHPAASQLQHLPVPSASQQQLHPMPSASQQQHHPRPSASQQQHHPMPSVPQQQYTSSGQHQQPSHQGHENFGQQVQPRVPQTMPRQQQITRVQGHVNPKSSSPAVQPNTAHLGPPNKTVNADMDEPCTRILGKRTIHELFNQIDPYQQLDPEVEEILMDIADEFVESITTFSCSLAKHRKSNMLESKDILLHVEKNWNITLPGFGGDEIKGVRKPVTNDIHKERLAVIKKSTGQPTGNAKGSLVKAPANIISSQNIKMREVT